MTLLVCDIAGTTIDEGGVVYRQLRESVEKQGITVTPDQVNQVKGTEKRSAIITLLSSGGFTPSEETINTAYNDFLEGLQTEYTNNPPTPIPGVEKLLLEFQRKGGKVALTTGFQRSIAEIVLSAAGWGARALSMAPDETTVSSRLIDEADNAPFSVDALVTSDTVRAGRPAPYLIHHAMELTGVTTSLRSFLRAIPQRIWMPPPTHACAESAFSPGHYHVTFWRPGPTRSCWTRWLTWTHRNRCQISMLRAKP